MAISAFNLMALSNSTLSATTPYPRMLVIAPKAVLTNWVHELKRWLDPRLHCMPVPGPRIPDPRNVRAGSHTIGIATVKYWPTYANIVVVNYDIVGKLRANLLAESWDLVVIDECHYLKSATAQRTTHVLGNLGAPIHEKSPEKAKAKGFPLLGRRRLFMTGTPLNKPIDLWPVLRSMHGPYDHNRFDMVGITLTGSDPVGGDWFKYVRRYCNAVKTQYGWDTNGASNLEELGERLAVQGMYRQDESVLELPPHMEQTIVFQPDEAFLAAENTVVMDAIEELIRNANGTSASTVVRNAYRDLQARLAALDPTQYQGIKVEEVFQKAKDTSGGEVSADFIRIVGESLAEQAVGLSAPLSAILFTEMSKIRALVGDAKVRVASPYVQALLTEELPADDPLLIFAYHKNCISALAEACGSVVGDANVATITGETSTEDRGAIISAFQGGELRVTVANLIAGGVGVTLTRSNRCVVVESDWRATTVDQALKRIHRRTQTRPCTTDFIVLDGTLDTHIVRKMLSKRRTAYVINEKVGATNALHAPVP